MTYFDPNRGYVVPAEDYESDTYGSLKDVAAVLKNVESKQTMLPDDLCDAAERLLYKYQIFVLQGVRENIGTRHKDVSWYLVERGDGRALISYQDGMHGEWCNECYADEVPLWLLIALFRRIARRKPLGDQVADDTIVAVATADEEFSALKRKEDAVRNIRLSRRGRDEGDYNE